MASATKNLILTWLALLVLTGVTVTATSLHLGNWSVIAALMIALVKATAVILIFMNVAKEPPIFRTMLIVAVVTLTVIFLLTFVDFSFR